MTLKEYFDNAKGYGVLATADAAGKVNTASMPARMSWMKKRSPLLWPSD